MPKERNEQRQPNRGQYTLIQSFNKKFFTMMKGFDGIKLKEKLVSGFNDSGLKI